MRIISIYNVVAKSCHIIRKVLGKLLSLVRRPRQAHYVGRDRKGTSQNSDSGTNPSYLEDEDSNDMLSFWKLQITVRKRSYVYSRKIMFPSGGRLKAHNAL